MNSSLLRSSSLISPSRTDPYSTSKSSSSISTLKIPWDTTIAKAVLKNTFGHSQFRPNQLEVIQAIISGKDAVALMATGSGKSLIYQFPTQYVKHYNDTVASLSSNPSSMSSSVMRSHLPSTLPGLPHKGCTIVISPLLSLMEDQTNALSRTSIKACALNSSTFDQKIWDNAANGEYDIVYTTPETVMTWLGTLRIMYIKNYIHMVAIDEAHCVSEWGCDFRPDYRRLSELREALPTVPIIALTATATPIVRDDIIRTLNLHNPYLMVSTFNRPNLFYSVKGKTNNIAEDIKRAIEEMPNKGSIIVYVNTQKEAQNIAALINRLPLGEENRGVLWANSNMTPTASSVNASSSNGWVTTRAPSLSSSTTTTTTTPIVPNASNTVSGRSVTPSATTIGSGPFGMQLPSSTINHVTTRTLPSAEADTSTAITPSNPSSSSATNKPSSVTRALPFSLGYINSSSSPYNRFHSTALPVAISTNTNGTNGGNDSALLPGAPARSGSVFGNALTSPHGESGLYTQRASFYHGGMTTEDRTAVHRAFLTDRVRIVVATLAFGMGIDKKDVRGIIHYGMPKNLEAYYQQTGRAGRDSEPSRCVLLWSHADFAILQNLLGTSVGAPSQVPPTSQPFYSTGVTGNTVTGSTNSSKNYSPQDGLLAIKKYVMSSRCRRRQILEYFGELPIQGTPEAERFGTDFVCSGCDICEMNTNHSAGTTLSVFTYDFTTDFRHMASAISFSGNYGLPTAIKVLRGLGGQDMETKFHGRQTTAPCYGAGRYRPEKYWMHIATMMVGAGLLEMYNKSFVNGIGRTITYTCYRLTTAGSSFLHNNNPPTLEPMQVPNDLREWLGVPSRVGMLNFPGAVALSTESKLERRIYEALSELRDNLANAANVGSYDICPEPLLKTMAAGRPGNMEVFRSLEGVSNAFAERYGERFLKVVKEQCEKLQLELRTDVAKPIVSTTHGVTLTASAPPTLTQLGQLRLVSEMQNTHTVLYPHVAVATTQMDSFKRVIENNVSIRTVANEKNIKVGTVQDHIIECIKGGLLAYIPLALCSFDVNSASHTAAYALRRYGVLNAGYAAELATAETAFEQLVRYLFQRMELDDPNKLKEICIALKAEVAHNYTDPNGQYKIKKLSWLPPHDDDDDEYFSTSESPRIDDGSSRSNHNTTYTEEGGMHSIRIPFMELQWLRGCRLRPIVQRIIPMDDGGTMDTNSSTRTSPQSTVSKEVKEIRHAYYATTRLVLALAESRIRYIHQLLYRRGVIPDEELGMDEEGMVQITRPTGTDDNDTYPNSSVLNSASLYDDSMDTHHYNTDNNLAIDQRGTVINVTTTDNQELSSSSSASPVILMDDQRIFHDTDGNSYRFGQLTEQTIEDSIPTESGNGINTRAVSPPVHTTLPTTITTTTSRPKEPIYPHPSVQPQPQHQTIDELDNVSPEEWEKFFEKIDQPPTSTLSTPSTATKRALSPPGNDFIHHHSYPPPSSVSSISSNTRDHSFYPANTSTKKFKTDLPSSFSNTMASPNRTSFIPSSSTNTATVSSPVDVAARLLRPSPHPSGLFAHETMITSPNKNIASSSHAWGKDKTESNGSTVIPPSVISLSSKPVSSSNASSATVTRNVRAEDVLD